MHTIASLLSPPLFMRVIKSPPHFCIPSLWGSQLSLICPLTSLHEASSFASCIYMPQEQTDRGGYRAQAQAPYLSVGGVVYGDSTPNAICDYCSNLVGRLLARAWYKPTALSCNFQRTSGLESDRHSLSISCQPMLSHRKGWSPSDL